MKIDIWNKQGNSLNKDMIRNSLFKKKRKLSHKNNKIKHYSKVLKESIYEYFNFFYLLFLKIYKNQFLNFK